MIDEKFSTYQKENTWVICSLDEIVCIVGWELMMISNLSLQQKKFILSNLWK